MADNITPLIHQLLKEIGPGRMSSTAYDTAWVARLSEVDLELSSQALNWICENQLPDGSWGASEPFYYHDRVISTLAAMIALTDRGKRHQYHKQIERGLLALERITASANQGLQADTNGATVGFEMIAPTLVTEAERLGLIKQHGERVLSQLSRQRAAKLALIQGKMISREVTAAFSAEMAGQDGHHMLDMDNLQERNGSVGNSPSATAYFALYHQPRNSKAMVYLRKWVSTKGGAPDFAPIDVFEPAWVLWNLSFIPDLDNGAFILCKSHLDSLQRAWQPGIGVGTAVECTIKDSDDTSLVYHVLSHYGRSADIEAILRYEEANHFRCFQLEVNPSVSANIHVLGALRQAGIEKKNPSVQKALKFLKGIRSDKYFWLDKWHASPYYATMHAIISMLDYEKAICNQAINWILNTQRANGSWGFYNKATAEETAYCLLALNLWQKTYGHIRQERIGKGASWLDRHKDPPYHPLWIGKGLYCPELVVRSAILSALALTNGT